MLTLLALVVDTLRTGFGEDGPNPRFFPEVEVWFWPSVVNVGTREVVQWAGTTPGRCGLVTP